MKHGTNGAVLQAAVFLLFLAGCLFGSAGEFAWPMAWAVLLVFAAFIAAAFVLLAPDLIRERTRIGAGTLGSDVVLASLAFVGFYPGTLIVAGLDRRCT